jgi:hypothetical protein
MTTRPRRPDLSALEVRVLYELNLCDSMCFDELMALLRLDRDLQTQLSGKPRWLKALLFHVPSNRMALEVALAHLQQRQLVRETQPPLTSLDGLLRRILPHSRESRGQRIFSLTAHGHDLLDHTATP